MPDPNPNAIKAVQDAAAKFVAEARAKAAGGLTVAEFGSLVIELLRVLVIGLETVPTDNAGKKAWALSIVAALFDQVAGYAVPLPLKPVWFVVRPIVRQLVLAAASGALEQVLNLTREQIVVPAPFLVPALPAPTPAPQGVTSTGQTWNGPPALPSPSWSKDAPTGAAGPAPAP